MKTNEGRGEKRIASNIINLGQHSVGKSMTIGMYDPKIPEALKEEMKKTEQQSTKFLEWVDKDQLRTD